MLKNKLVATLSNASRLCANIPNVMSLVCTGEPPCSIMDSKPGSIRNTGSESFSHVFNNHLVNGFKGNPMCYQGFNI